MKKHLSTLIALIVNLYSTALLGCPTCVGRNHEESPPFFSEEFYKPQEGMDELYEKLIEQEKGSNQAAAQEAKKKEAL